MKSKPNNKSDNSSISPDERRTLEVEYGIAFEAFKMENSQTWQTFQIVTTLALASLAFIGQLKSNGKITWTVSLAVGIAMISILVGWLALAKRWWAFAGQELYRMREIEEYLGMYLFREGDWLRKPLNDSAIQNLNPEIRTQYKKLHKAFPKFPKYRWRQQVISSIIVIALILVWVLFMVADVLSLI